MITCNFSKHTCEDTPLSVMSGCGRIHTGKQCSSLRVIFGDRTWGVLCAGHLEFQPRHIYCWDSKETPIITRTSTNQPPGECLQRYFSSLQTLNFACVHISVSHSPSLWRGGLLWARCGTKRKTQGACYGFLCALFHQHQAFFAQQSAKPQHLLSPRWWNVGT